MNWRTTAGNAGFIAGGLLLAYIAGYGPLCAYSRGTDGRIWRIYKPMWEAANRTTWNYSYINFWEDLGYRTNVLRLDYRIEDERVAGEAPMDRMWPLCEIAFQRGKSDTPGSVVRKFLADPDWNVRACAARTLGYMGYREAIPELTATLARTEDWRLVYCAAEALGRLHAEPALPALDQLATSHWYPPVRTMAQQARQHILEGTHPAESKPDDGNFAFEFFDFENAGQSLDSLEVEEASSLALSVNASARQPQPFRMLSLDEMATFTLQGVKVDRGFLTADWGPGIEFLNAKGKSVRIWEGDVEAIYETPGGILAVTGSVHLTRNNGFLLRLTQDKNGDWSAGKCRALPGAPKFSRLLQNGDVFVSCVGGMVVITPNGTMKSLARAEVVMPNTKEPDE